MEGKTLISQTEFQAESGVASTWKKYQCSGIIRLENVVLVPVEWLLSLA